MDDIVSFHQLTESDLRKIVDIHLNKLLKRAENIGYHVTVDDKAKDWFVDEVYTSKFGVRILKRLIQNQVENQLSFLIMQNKIKPGQEVFLNVDPTGKNYRFLPKKLKPFAPKKWKKCPLCKNPLKMKQRKIRLNETRFNASLIGLV